MTGDITDITSNSAHCSGDVTSAGNGIISAKGICFGTHQNPTIYNNVINCGDSLGMFETIIDNLDINTLYYIRAFATNEQGTAYGEQKSFTTLGQVPILITIPITQVTSNSAVSGGSINDDGGNAVIDKGVCWSTHAGPNINDYHTSDGAGNNAFISNLVDLLPNTQYYVRAYATNSQGTGYGNELTFTTTASLPIITTKSISDITENSAKSGGNITNDGGVDITARGVCWSTAHNPTLNDQHTSDGTGIGEFNSTITGLNANVKYYVRAYATNNYGTAYGDEREFTTVIGSPSVTTSSVTSITASSAICGGNVTNSGGGTITARGVCWSTTHNPTTNGNHTNDGTGTGGFVSNITGLNNNTTYYVRAYATNSNGTSYGEERSFLTQEGLAVVTTNNVTNITNNSAVSGGNITDDGGFSITARGVCWSTSQNPTTSGSHTTNGTGTGSFSSNMTGLNYNTTYYVRAYATNSKGTSYGDEKTFTTNRVAPTVTTKEVTSVTSNSAVCGGNVTSDGGANVTARGVCYGTSQNPTISGNHTSDGNGTGQFTSTLTGLTDNTTYYVRAYATNSEGTSYGEQKTFSTSHDVVIPTITTNDVSNISTTTATCGGNVTSAGYGTVSARGVCWSTSQNPTINNSHTTNGTGTGTFTSSITGLTANTTYYVRAYATNEAGTAYGAQKTFTTNEDVTIPTVTTNNVSDITTTTATCGGNVTSAGNGTVSARGVCWSTTSNPTISNSHTTNGSGTGTFTSSITGLTPNTTYYVRAYATNEAGTAYGTQKTFTTNEDITIPIVTTNNVSDITTTTASCGGNVTSVGNGTVSARGVCWSTTSNPTISNSHTTNGTGTGTFTSSITGLSANTTYYVRAYVTNQAGTAYGEQKSFTTLSGGGGTAPTGAINGLFSVSATQQVYFSQGNLQYIGSASTHYWKFAENQWDYLGNNGQGSTNQNVDRDLFGWGTSGYNHGAGCYQPWSTSTYNDSYNAYGSSTYNLYDQTGQADWGYNPISNSGNQINQWRTLTHEEWVYVFNTRTTTSGIRYAKAKVNNVNGVVLLPDDWSTSYYSLSNTNTSSASYSSNTISATQWSTLEQHGAVFLPAAGDRVEVTVIDVGSVGFYWSASHGNSGNAYCIEFWEDNFFPQYGNYRSAGRSVRLVQDAE
ncbi:MAG: hypothetical protein II401_04900 [Bacteroidales bacterium]|nr:hypothetical protein [Bacteroidales bacterium]